MANENRRGDFSDRNAIKPVNAEIQLKDFDGRTRNQLDNAISRLYARIYMNGQPYSKWNDMQALVKFVKANVYSEVIDYGR